MSICTVLLSRGLSSDKSKTNGLPVGRVIEIQFGDQSAKWRSMPAMEKIFYWKTVKLTDAQKDEINGAINTPFYALNGSVIIPKKDVDLNCFSSSEKDSLKSSGRKIDGMGQMIDRSNFIISQR